MKFLRLLFTAGLLATIFTGCKEEELPRYDLNIISPSFREAYLHYNPHENENLQYELLFAADYSKVITEENRHLLESLTVVDDRISDETARELIRICQEENIPVFFFMKDISNEILSRYDKAFCLTADYTYIGEKFAEKINRMWREEIIDKNKDKIFQFSVIKTETLSPIYQEFYDRLLAYIELLGVPLQQQEEIFLTKGDVLDYCMKNQKSNEAYFILQSDYISALSEEYDPAKDGVEILGIYFGLKNIYEELPYMYLCFIDYTEYFNVRDTMLGNMDNHGYPFENIEHSVIDKTVYLEPVV